MWEHGLLVVRMMPSGKVHEVCNVPRWKHTQFSSPITSAESERIRANGKFPRRQTSAPRYDGMTSPSRKDVGI